MLIRHTHTKEYTLVNELIIWVVEKYMESRGWKGNAIVFLFLFFSFTKKKGGEWGPTN